MMIGLRRWMTIGLAVAVVAVLGLRGWGQDVPPAGAATTQAGTGGAPASTGATTQAATQAAVGETAPAAAQATEEPAAAPAGLDSPRATMFTFLGGMHEVRGGDVRAWEKVLACFDLGAMSGESGQEVAEQLLEVLDRISEVKPEELPDAATAADWGIRSYRYFPRLPEHAALLGKLEGAPPGKIVLARQADGRWLFSSATVAGAPGLYEALKDQPPAYLGAGSQIADVLGPTFSRSTWWGWAFLLSAVFIGVLLGRAVQGALRGVSRRFKDRQSHLRGTVFENAASPLSLLLLTLGIHAGMGGLVLSEALSEFVTRVLGFFYILVAGWFLYNLVDVIDLWLRSITSKTETRLDDMVVPLIRKTLRVFLVIVFTLVVAQNVFGLNIVSFLAGLGLAGLAISLAAQDSVKNLFGSITVFFDKPFMVGDRIVFDASEGTVEEIGFRSTRIRTLEGHLVTIPNMKFIDGSVQNVAARPYIRRVLDVTVTYDTAPDKMELAVKILRDLLADAQTAQPFDMEKLPPRVAFNDFNAASLNIRVLYWYTLRDGRDYWGYLEHAQRFNMMLLRAYNEAGIDFAFPTQTLFLAGDGKRPLEVALAGGGPPAPAGDR